MFFKPKPPKKPAWARSQARRVAGAESGRKNVQSGHWDRITEVGRTIGGHVAGRIAVESGQLSSVRTTVDSASWIPLQAKGCRIGGRVQGPKNVASGQLARARQARLDKLRSSHS